MNMQLARTLMDDYARATGLVGEETRPKRYLWTDAFAVCNFIGLYRALGDDRFLGLAERLVAQVHLTLCRHREDDSRSGWISGLSEEDGKQHPTIGGVRIGKPLNERTPGQSLDSRLEWDMDGQYFHYLTKWMHALHCLGRQTGDFAYRRWARELALTAHNAFCYELSEEGSKRMVWKMSIDLGRVLVSSMGHHDALDGLITYLELQSAEPRNTPNRGKLAAAIAEASAMCEKGRWMTDDPLGIGGLLDDGGRLAQLVFRRNLPRLPLLMHLLSEARRSLDAFARSPLLTFPAERRLAFRELGLSIGLHAIEYVKPLVTGDAEVTGLMKSILEHRSLAVQIETFWSEPSHRESASWLEHEDINRVMLATSLAPEGYLAI